MSSTIGIDQSYSGFGLVVYSGGTHEQVLGKFEPKKYGTGISRLNAIENWLFDQLDGIETKVIHVAMEGYANGAKFGRETAGELGAAVKRVLLDHFGDKLNGLGYPTIVPPTSLKKFVTGKGNATKDQMLLHTYKKWGVEFADNNLADAYGLARMADAIENGTYLKYESDVLSALTLHTEQFPRA